MIVDVILSGQKPIQTERWQQFGHKKVLTNEGRSCWFDLITEGVNPTTLLCPTRSMASVFHFVHQCLYPTPTVSLRFISGWKTCPSVRPSCYTLHPLLVFTTTVLCFPTFGLKGGYSLKHLFKNNKLLVGGNETNSTAMKVWTRESFCEQAGNGRWICVYFIDDQYHQPAHWAIWTQCSTWNTRPSVGVHTQ